MILNSFSRILNRTIALIFENVPKNPSLALHHQQTAVDSEIIIVYLHHSLIPAPYWSPFVLLNNSTVLQGSVATSLILVLENIQSNASYGCDKSITFFTYIHVLHILSFNTFPFTFLSYTCITFRPFFAPFTSFLTFFIPKCFSPSILSHLLSASFFAICTDFSTSFLAFYYLSQVYPFLLCSNSYYKFSFSFITIIFVPPFAPSSETPFFQYFHTTHLNEV